jgi:cation transporter-like permease
MAASLIILIAYTTAILTFKRGLDPDNFVIPIESSLADSLTTISLFAALSLLG